MVKIFFGCSMRGGFPHTSQDELRQLADIIETIGGKLMSRHQVSPTFSDEESAFAARDIHDRDYDWLLGAELGVWEISNPSLGVGSEISDFIYQGKPVLCLYKKELEKTLSAYISGKQGSKHVKTPFQCSSYDSMAEAKTIIQKFVEHYQLHTPAAETVKLPPLQPLKPGKTNIGFIGTGIMGLSMAGHLQHAGYQLYIHNRTKDKAAKLLDRGAIWCQSSGEVANQSNVVITMVSLPSDVRAVYLGRDGILEAARPGLVACDMTTSEPSLAIEIFNAAKAKVFTLANAKSVITMDAPVSGGDVGAREARLAIMVGGPEEGFHYLLPLFRLMGKNIVYMGPVGAGQHTKMCNQMTIAGTMMGMIEAMRYAKYSGLNLQEMLSAIQSGAAQSWSLSNLAPRVVAGNFGPGFKIEHFTKDMAIAQQEADRLKVNTPVLDKALEIYRLAEKAGGAAYGTHGLFKLWEEHPDW